MLLTSRQPRPFHLVEHFQQRGRKEEPSGHKKNNKKQKQKEGFYFNPYILSLMYFRCNKVYSCVILPLFVNLSRPRLALTVHSVYKQNISSE